MKAVLLAAGRSFRTKPIEDKNFLSFCGKFLIEHQVLSLFKAGFRDIAIIGGAHNLDRLTAAAKNIMRTNQARKAHLEVLEQKNLDQGMAGAVMSAEKFIGEDPFLVVSSNDVLDESAFMLIKKQLRGLAGGTGGKIARFARNEGAGTKKACGLLLAKKVNEYFPGGYLQLAKNGVISTIVEKPGEGKEPSDLVNIVVHFHHDAPALFKALKSHSSVNDDHYEQALQSLFDAGIEYRAVSFNGFWQPIKYPWHVLEVMDHFMPHATRIIRGKKVSIAKSAVVKGPVFLDDGARIFEGAVISGPAYIGKNSIVANGALVRNSNVGSDSVIGFGSEIARSYIGNGVWTHTNYIGDSIIGDNVSFGSGTVVGNFRLDEGLISVNIKGEKISSKRDKLGIITGDNIRCGINSSFMPGIRIGSNSMIGAGIVIAEDVSENSFVRGDHVLKVTPNKAKIIPRNRKI